MDINELIERVEALTGADRKVDWMIADATDHPSFEKRFENMWPPFGPKSKLDRDIPSYTSSIDAALAFAERVLPGCGYALNGGHFKDEATVWLGEAKAFSQQTRFQASAPTLPLAIILATLKAKVSE